MIVKNKPSSSKGIEKFKFKKNSLVNQKKVQVTYKDEEWDKISLFSLIQQMYTK